MTVVILDRSKLSGSGASEPHAKELLDKVDATITQSNTNSSALAQTDDYIRCDEDFSNKGTTAYTEGYDVSTVTGAGTNVITAGKATLTTDTNINDYESTFSNLAVFNRGDYVRASLSVNDVTDVEFRFGMYASLTKYVLATLKTGVDANLHLEINDGTGAETEDLGITPANDTDLDITLWTDSNGVPSISVNGTTITLSTITLAMTTDAHKVMWDVKTLAAAARVLTVDWLKSKRAI